MIVEVKLFAAAKQVAGRDSLDVELDEGATVADLREKMSSRYPGLAGLFARAVFSINAEFAHDEQIIPNAGEIACIPPLLAEGKARRLAVDFVSQDRKERIPHSLNRSPGL